MIPFWNEHTKPCNMKLEKGGQCNFLKIINFSSVPLYVPQLTLCFISPGCGEDTWHVARVAVFAHSPNNRRECGGRYRQILFLTRLSGICPIYPPLDTPTTLCVHTQSFGCRATLTEYSTKNILTLKNIWLPMLLRERWRSGTEDVMRGSRQRCSGVTGTTATSVTGLRPRDNCSVLGPYLADIIEQCRYCVRQVLLHQCVFFMHIISNTNTSTCVACLLVSGIVQYLVLQAWR